MPAETHRPGPGAVGAVYVHAPFCTRRCFYCDFAVQVRRTGDADEWLAALSGEMAAVEREGRFSLAPELDSVFVGGGTPSLLGPEAMAGLAGILGRERLGSPQLEWTAEANPESFTADVAEGWRRAGVNRISLGVQTFHEEALRWMGRLHGSEGALAAVARAGDAGFENVSLDLIFGLPSHVGRDWAADLARAVDLGMPHVSLYGLTVESGTPLGRAVKEGRETVADEQQYREEYLLAAEVLAAAGYRHYEVSNFCLPGKASRHNQAYWDGSPYLGLGNGAHSYMHPERRWNVRAWPAYQEAAGSGSPTVAEREILDDEAHRLERVWLGLRTDTGLPEQAMDTPERQLVASWVSSGWAEREEGRIFLTAEGWLLLDRLAVAFDEAATSSP